MSLLLRNKVVCKDVLHWMYVFFCLIQCQMIPAKLQAETNNKFHSPAHNLLWTPRSEKIAYRVISRCAPTLWQSHSTEQCDGQLLFWTPQCAFQWQMTFDYSFYSLFFALTFALHRVWVEPESAVAFTSVSVSHPHAKSVCTPTLDAAFTTTTFKQILNCLAKLVNLNSFKSL